MLKDTLNHDLDHSRNDVVPQRTQIDATIPADQMESIASSEKEGAQARVHVDSEQVDEF